MEEYISGFVELENNQQMDEIIKKLNNKYPIFIATVDEKEFSYYPDHYLPIGSHFAFCIGDNDKYIPYEISLISNDDWAPEADFDLPKKSNDRLSLLAEILVDIIAQSKTKRMILALFDYSLYGKIRKIKCIKIDQLAEVIQHDIEVYGGPPNTLYEILVD